MNSFDISVLIFLSIFFVRGLFRGIILELITLIGLILGYLVAITYLDPFQNIILVFFPELPAIATKITCFTLLFVGTNLLLRLAGSFFSKTLKFAMLGWVNHLLGGLAGLVKSVFIVTIIVFLINLLPYSELLLDKIDSRNSFFYPLFKILGPQLYDQIQSWI